jgi:hypothetical protein
MSPSIRTRVVRPLGLVAAVTGALALLIQCRASDADDGDSGRALEVNASSAWNTIYEVLQHPRCMNCHPSGDRPLVGDAPEVHPQNVQRGPEGRGLYAMRCDACHQTSNTPGAHVPPGAPHWQLPHPDMPLVFEGLSSGDLCRQMKDPKRNGNRTPEQILEHVASDPLVLWGWSPGEGRAPVPIPHDQLVTATRAWIEGGCDCPE